MDRARTDSLDALVVGGGISGLTAAFRLERGGARVALLEASDRVGGAITSRHEDGFRFELGPNTVLESRAAVGDLIRDVGLEPVRLEASPLAKRRFVYRRGRLVALPSGPVSFLRTSLFTSAAKWRIAREPFVRRASPDEEETVGAFVRRRLGREVLDVAVGPFVSGVYAGDPERLSMRHAVAKLYRLEQEHGSLIRGAVARRKGPQPGGKMFTFEAGLASLPDRLAERLSDVRLGTAAQAVRRAADGFAVTTASGDVAARRVVLAVPADAAARMLAPLASETDAGPALDLTPLQDLPYAPVALLALGFRREDVRHALDGFGFLAPRGEGLRVLGCLFCSSIFPRRAPEGHVALATFLGGRTDPDAVVLQEAALLDRALADLDRALGLRRRPVAVAIRRWPSAIPQYELGHGRVLDLASRIEARCPGLVLDGNVLGGISVPDCIAKATGVAERLLSRDRDGA